MITKKTTPIIDIVNCQFAVTGTKVEYRLFGILLYRKILYLPNRHGVKEYDYQINI